MQNSLWKLTALAAVVGIGILAVLQAQRGLSRPGDDKIAEVLRDAAAVEDTAADAAPLGSPANAGARPAGRAADTSGFETVGKRAPRASIPFDDAQAANDEPEPWDGKPAPDPRSGETGKPTAAPRPRGLDFREPSPDTRSSAPGANASSDSDNGDPFAQSEPPAGPDLGPQPSATGTVTLAGNSEPADDPFARPAPRSRNNAPLRTADLDERADVQAAMPAPEEREPAGRAATDVPAGSPGPQLVVPASGDSDGSFFGDDVPSKPATKAIPSRQDPAFDPPPSGRDYDRAPTRESGRFEPELSRPEPRSARERDLDPSGSAPKDVPAAAFPDLPLDGSFPGAAPPKSSDPPAEPLEKPLPRSRPEPSSSDARPLRSLPEPGASRGLRNDSPSDFPAESEPSTKGDRPPALLPVDPGESPMPRTRPSREPRSRDSRTDDASPRIDDSYPARRDNPYTRREPPRSANPLVPAGADPAGDEVVGDGTVEPGTPKGPQRPQLKIEKQAPQNATLGQPMVYNIVIKNVGESAAHDVIVEDRVPRGTQLSGTNPQAELVDKTLVWKLGTMQPGEERKIGVRVVPVSEGQIGSIATVNFVAEIGSKTLITSPKLHLDLSTPKQVRQGEPVPVTFQIRNTGNAEAKGVIIRNLVPEGLRHPDGNDLEYDLGTLPAGATREVKLTLSAVKAGETLNKAIATADGGVTAEATSNLEIVGPSLAVSRSGPKKTWLGRTAQYSTTITNESDTMVPTATVIETVPAGMDVLEAPNAHISADRRTLSWRIDRLGPHQSAELKVKLLPKTTGTKSSTVKVSEGPGQPHEVTTETEVAGAAHLDADVSGADGPLGVGDKVTFKLVVRNRGNEAASNVKLTLGLPSEVEYVSSDSRAEPSRDGRELSLPAIPRLDPGREAVYQVVVKTNRDGDARLTLTTDADDLRAPLVKEEQLVILADDAPATVTTPRRR